MGAIAVGIMAYVQPLIDGTDGSLELLSRQEKAGQVRYWQYGKAVPSDLT
jgi:hypothetical protein